MNNRYILQRNNPRPVIRYLKYCPRMTVQSLISTQTPQIQAFYPQLTLRNSQLCSSFCFPQSSNSPIKRYVSVERFKPPSPQPFSPPPLFKSVSPPERKFSYISNPRNTVGQETPTKSQESIYQIEYMDDTVYYGQIKVTKRQGTGVLYDKNKNLIYMGEWKDDLYHGCGILHQNGMVYKGEFKNGHFEGQGIIEEQEKKFYGFFKNGKKNGPGTLYEDSKTIKGIWKNDRLSTEC